MGKRLEGRVAIVTGAGEGIGRAEAMGLAAEGAAVIVNDLGARPDGEGASSSPADAVVKEIEDAGGTARANYSDVGDFQQMAELVEQAKEAFGRLDIVVNNAGNYRVAPFLELTEEDWDSVIRVHLKGHFNLLRHACPVFKEQGYGRIVNTSSRSGLGDVGRANYSAAKEGIVGLTRALARELGPLGITCNAVRPIAVTRLLPISTVGMQVSPDLPPPETIAPVVTYLASEESAYINGRTFNIRGNELTLYSEPDMFRTVWAPGEAWTVDELATVMQTALARDLTNEWQDPKVGHTVAGRRGASIV